MTLIFGSVTRSGDGSRFTLDFERILATDIDDAWQAVTSPERLVRWMAPYTGELALGGEWQALDDDGSVWCRGTVSECEPPHRFVTSWHAIDEEPTVLTVSLDTADGGTRLSLHHEGVQSRYYAPGWQSYLEQLDDLLGAAEASVIDPDRVVGVTWDERYNELRVAWDTHFDALGD
ncbi:MAG TPA: SRPBCC domain-containing protein [Terrimesophilobacter sp.]|nr:SRPBCC domain-containing protein [Terrimesophilobacter sp.]